MSRRIIAYIGRVVCFMIVGIVLLLGIQSVLSKKWVYPSFSEAPLYGMSEFYQLAENSSIEVAFLSPSHILYGLDPMSIYEHSGIVTYNLGSTSQPMGVSCFLLSELLKSQHPQVVMLDVQKLFHDDFTEQSYRAILDNAPFSLNKLELALEYASNYPTEKLPGSLLGVFLPIYRYHDRWSELSEMDFKQIEECNYYRKGYYISTSIAPCFGSVEWMNEEAEQMQQNIGWTYSVTDGASSDFRQDGALYEPSVSETSLGQLKQMKQMCDKSGVTLVLIKIPTVGDPQYNDSAWTRLRSDAAKKLAAELGLDFLDLLYDVDLGIDWNRDSIDGGTHLNYLGASKVSAFLGDYLKQEVRTAGTECQAYEEDIPAYHTMCRVAQLQMADSLPTYLDALRECEDISVFCSVADDMMSNLTEESQDALKRFGFQTDFGSLNYSDAFLAVVDDGLVRCEISSNRHIADEGALDCGSQYQISSSGWLAGAESQIIIDGNEYSMNRRGINIVVLDNTSGLVLDSVAFDTWDLPENQLAIRDNNNTERFLREYEHYLMIQNAKNGVGA